MCTCRGVCVCVCISVLCCWLFLYSALLFTLEQTHCALVACDSEWVTRFTQLVLNIHCSGVLTALFGCYMAGATWLWFVCMCVLWCVHAQYLAWLEKDRSLTRWGGRGLRTGTGKTLTKGDHTLYRLQADDGRVRPLLLLLFSRPNHCVLGWRHGTLRVCTQTSLIQQP